MALGLDSEDRGGRFRFGEGFGIDRRIGSTSWFRLPTMRMTL